MGKNHALDSVRQPSPFCFSRPGILPTLPLSLLKSSLSQLQATDNTRFLACVTSRTVLSPAQRFRCGPDTVPLALQLTQLFVDFPFFTLDCRYGDLEPLTDCGDPVAHNKNDVFYGPPGVQFASGLPLASYDCLAPSFAVLGRLEIEGGNHPST